MSESTLSFNIEGLEELQESFKDLAKKYPDKAGSLLRKDGNQLKKNIVKNAQVLKDNWHTNESGKRYRTKLSLKTNKAYSVSQVKGFGENQYIEIKAKAPHFHLVEHGHEEYDFHGKSTGRFVQGKHFMEKARKEYERVMLENVDRMIDGLLKEGGFI